MSSISFGIPLSGLAHQSARLAGSAANVANLGSRPADGDRDGFVPTRVTGVSAPDGGVRSERRAVAPPSVPFFDPSGGALAARPNVSLAEEAVVQRQAKIAFAANLKVLEAQDEQIGALLDLKS